MTTAFVLDALEQALHQRRPVSINGIKPTHRRLCATSWGPSYTINHIS